MTRRASDEAFEVLNRVRAYRDRPVPEHLRHRIEPKPDGTGYQLVTHYGYVLFAAPDIRAVKVYYTRHCTPGGIGEPGE